MATYGWYDGHKVFATGDTAGLKQLANTGSMTYRSFDWQTCTARNAEVAQVMSCPFPITEDDYKASLYVPSYGSWLYGRLMCPYQLGSSYHLGHKAIKEPPVYRVSQYLTILSDLVTEALISADRDIKQIATTYYQVKDSLNNLVNSPDYRDRALPAGQNVTGVAYKLATLLRDRDGSTAVAKEFVDYVNQLPPDAFFRAMQVIALENILLNDEGEPIATLGLFHHSVFFDGDLIFASRHLTGNSESDDTNDFIRYWVKRSLQEALKHIPAMNVDHITSMDELVETIHRQAGKQVENKLRHVYLQKLVQDEILSQPGLSLESVKAMLPSLLALARETKGITSLMMAILPDMAKIPNLNQSLAELLLRASADGDKKKLIIPIESLKQTLPPEQLTSQLQSNIDRIKNHRSAILRPPTWACAMPDNHHGSALQTFIEAFRNNVRNGLAPLQQNEAMDIDKSVGHTNRPLQPIDEKRLHQSLLRDSSGNHVLIKQLYDHIARLTVNGNNAELTQLIQELKSRESDDKRRLISARSACRLVGRLLQQQLAASQIDVASVESVFNQLKSTLPTIDSYLSATDVLHHTYGRGCISRIVQALFQHFTSIDDHRQSGDLEPIEFHTLPECIARQQTRNQMLHVARNNRRYECCVCLQANEIPRLLNHNTAPVGQPETNGHPGMPVCKPCVERLLRVFPPRCPACRVNITERDYVPFVPDVVSYGDK